jgi:hypothetical protein
VSKPGLEPTTHPQAGRPAKSGCRKVFAVIIPKLVPPRGIEPRSSVLQTVAMTTSAKAALIGVSNGERSHSNTFTECGAKPLHYGHH